MAIANWKPWLILSLLLVVATVMGVAQFSYAPLMPFLEKTLNLTPVQIGSLASVTFLGGAVAIPLAGWLVDIYNVKLVSLGSCAFVLLGLMGMGLANTYGAIVFFFFLIGLGFGGTHPISVKGVMIWIPAKLRAFSIGLLQANFPLGAALAAATLPSIAIKSSYQWSYIYLFVILLIITIAFAIFYYDPKEAEYSGLKAVSSTERVNQSFTCLAGSILKWCPIPLLFSMTNAAWTTFLVSYLYHDLGLTVVGASGFMAFSQAAGAIGRPLLGLGSDKLFKGNRKTIVCLLAFIGGVFLLSLLVLTNHFSGSFLLIPVVMVIGFTTMGWNGPFYTMIGEMVGVRNAGRGTSLTMSFSFGGAVLGPLLFGFLVDNYSYRLAFLVFATSLIVLGAFYSFIRVQPQVEVGKSHHLSGAAVES